jgi:hypothetical protein
MFMYMPEGQMDAQSVHRESSPTVHSAERYLFGPQVSLHEEHTE